jgi:hypothetical protein
MKILVTDGLECPDGAPNVLYYFDSPGFAIVVIGIDAVCTAMLVLDSCPFVGEASK